MQTDEDIILFISNNTFVDGVSLSETYPQISDWITEMKNSANFEEMFNFDAIRAPETPEMPQPISMQA